MKLKILCFSVFIFSFKTASFILKTTTSAITSLFIFILQLFDMAQAFGIIVAAIMLSISLVHFYWAMGGKSGFANTVPEKKEGKKVVNPTKFDAAIVFVGLLAMSVFILIRIDIIDFILPP